MKYYLIMFAMLFGIFIVTTEKVDAQEWRQKPVQCGNPESALQILSTAEEKALVGGLTTILDTNGSSTLFPFYLFVNTESGTFTIIEYHLSSNEVCIIGYGQAIDFDVHKLFEKKEQKNSF